MKKLRKIASLVIAATLLSSSMATTLSVSAAQVSAPQSSVAAASDYQLADSVDKGVILHAFNWSYNSIKENLPAIAAAGYTTVQTSPVQQPKDFGSSKDVTGQWWKLYQPVSMQIAQKTWLGTKEELKSLCAEADKYGVKIICDIVSNHLGNELETDPNSLSTQIQTYQPDFYNNKSTYFHSYTGNASDGSVQAVVHGHVSACPDLNTGNSNVQNAVVSLLKDCIDCGVDGFRFDAAKHIETPDDGSYASSYWSTISSQAGSYYKQKTGKDLFIYGEILNTCGAGRKYSSYTKYINVTDNRTGDAVLKAVNDGNASTAANANYKSGCQASDVVLWAESHDTFEGESGSAGLSNTSKVSDDKITKAWAIVAARKDSTALFFARPGSALMGEAATNITYKSTAVAEVNKFHNLFAGQSEKLGSSGSIAYVARGNSGIVLSNCTGSGSSVNIAGTGLANGTYTDTITGNKFTVSNGTLSGSIGSTGVAVVYNGTTTPRNTCSVESGEFSDDTMTVSLGLENATSGTYCLDNSSPVAYTGKTTIRIGSDYNYGDTINLTLTATDGSKTTTATYKYTKKESASSGVYVWLNPARKTTWTAPYTVYIYDEDTNPSMTYSISGWPGIQMTKDSKTGYYYYEVPSKTCIGKDADGNESEVSFDLAHSPNTYVIFVDSAGHQYPGANARTKIKLEGSSKIYADTASNSWGNTTLTPSAQTPVEATNVTKGTVATEATTKPTEATTKPTEATTKPTVPTTKPTVPTTKPTDPTTPTVVNGIYGDVNGDGYVTIVDATIIQKHVSEIEMIPNQYLVLADVNNDGIISEIDATYIQKYYAELDGTALVGKPYIDVDPTVATTEPTVPTTKPTEPPTEPTQPLPSDTYTLYFKTTLGWMTSDGVSLFAYDLSTGDSYLFEKDDSAYPNVYTVEVPESVSNVSAYRSLSEVDETPVASETGPVYNCWNAKVNPKNNCITLSADEIVSVGPYVEEQAPEFELDRVYFDNSKAKWSDVYIYGWAESGLGNVAAHMTQIPGTNVWYYDFDTPLLPGSKCFLFKDTETTWKNQTVDILIVDGKNCYTANAGSKTGGTWSVYNGSDPQSGATANKPKSVRRRLLSFRLHQRR